jgi:hypothetical protein
VLTRPQSLALYDGNGLGFFLGAFPWSFALEAVLGTVEESGRGGEVETVGGHIFFSQEKGGFIKY